MELTVKNRVDVLLKGIDEQVVYQQALIKNQRLIEKSISDLKDTIKSESESLDIVANAVEVLSNISDESVKSNYEFIESSVNSALAKIFPDRLRKIKLYDYQRRGYPQLEVKMEVGNGITRTIKSDSGHGVAQVVSILCILCLIVINGERRFLALDEMTSGMSGNTRAVMDSILWAFADIGFQFILVDHGYIPKGAEVCIMEAENDIGKLVDTYIEPNGVYNEGKRSRKGYSLTVEDR